MVAAPAVAVRQRLIGVDAARGLALFGMMAVHVLPGPTAPGGEAPITALVYRAAEGRSAALFAVLAGVSLILSRASRAQIAIRAVLVAAVGLSLGSLAGPIAVILTIYAVLFLLALPFVRLPAAALAVLAVLWAVLSPLASQWLRMNGVSGFPSNPAWIDLMHPLALAQDLLITGYYPALTWMTYLLAGLAVGQVLDRACLLTPRRCEQVPGGVLRKAEEPLVAELREATTTPRSARRVALTGLGVTLMGWLIGTLTVAAAGGVAALGQQIEPWSVLTGRGPHLLDETFYGTTPTTSWWWAGVNAPHSGAIGDLVQTTGSALVLLGAALMLAPWANMWIRPLAAAGAMTLSLYTLHTLIMDAVASIPPDDRPPRWPLLLAQVTLALIAASAWGAPKHRGPLEDVVSSAVRAATDRRA